MESSDTDVKEHGLTEAQANADWCAEYRTICLQRPPDYSYYG
jgi:casein kinase II subunit alpha